MLGFLGWVVLEVGVRGWNSRVLEFSAGWC